jgi:hypothetical protein
MVRKYHVLSVQNVMGRWVENCHKICTVLGALLLLLFLLRKAMILIYVFVIRHIQNWYYRKRMRCCELDCTGRVYDPGARYSEHGSIYT